MEDHQQQEVSDRDRQDCTCGHWRLGHIKGRKCSYCSCEIFATSDTLRVLAMLKPDETIDEPPPVAPKVRHETGCVECGASPILATGDWPDRLCLEHYYEACARPPRVVLTFDDGHREMRPNYIYRPLYRDVLEEDGEDGDVTITWFKREHEQRESGKVVMQFYRQVPAPVNALGKPNADELRDHATDAALYAWGRAKLPISKAAQHEDMARMIAEYRKERASDRRWKTAYLAMSVSAVIALAIMRACS